ncbi:hypothetical protein GGP41_008471 [Bipolaris sorokiniana]|uniref:N-acetyltransferase domain-containing protein n=1 Tax=Cochliobolus sativus TaxID=45130 RepID=A0A8H5ZD41_COCSA|nr:hypothetical protein GGP41_008471 [Bipolaris sorokiniana]
MIPSKISTERLTLLHLTNTHPSHPHVQLFHENWSNLTATAWSLRGATKSLEESREWMIESLDRFDSYFYAVFARYAFFPAAWGRGYGTEANRGLLNAYSAAVGQQSGGKGRGYVEAAVDDENAGSLALIQKLGFERVGWRESEKVWLNGGWREGYWVYGLHI